MRLSRRFALPLLTVLVIQGCLFVPAEDVEGEDPFYFETGTDGQGASFAEMGSYDSKYLQPSPASFQCGVECADSMYNSATWFFPIMRVY